MICSLISLMRPYQWSKNVFIFAPAFFAMQITNIDSILTLAVVFISFSLVCSSVYVFNDIVDRELDRMHPTKKFRPIASGKISLGIAIFFALALLITGGGGGGNTP